MRPALCGWSLSVARLCQRTAPYPRGVNDQDDPPPETPPEPAWAEGMIKPPPWRDHGARTLYDNPWMMLTAHDAVAPTGAHADYTVVRHKHLAGGVLPIHDDGTVTLVGQQRFALMAYSWEMPEGGIAPGEDPLAGIQRELAEEAGLRAVHWRPVLSVDLSNSITDERAETWLAWGLSPVDAAPDATEALAVVRVPFTALLKEIDRGAVRDLMTVATALKAYHMARESILPGWLSHAMLSRG